MRSISTTPDSGTLCSYGLHVSWSNVLCHSEHSKAKQSKLASLLPSLSGPLRSSLSSLSTPHIAPTAFRSLRTDSTGSLPTSAACFIVLARVVLRVLIIASPFLSPSLSVGRCLIRPGPAAVLSLAIMSRDFYSSQAYDLRKQSEEGAEGARKQQQTWEPRGLTPLTVKQILQALPADSGELMVRGKPLQQVSAMFTHSAAEY